MQPAVIHRLEDGVGIVIAVSSDLDDLDAVLQPVDEVRQRIPLKVLGQQLADVFVALDEVAHRIAVCGRGSERLSLVQRRHTSDSVLDIEVERLLAERIRQDQFVDVRLVVAIL
ncbi:Uncharacterised protein [Mycobacteroides abscessus subsp. abscessus]|nr:Uncharacterised protein [Mycobacteroides abscessus subsp. abscessus]